MKPSLHLNCKKATEMVEQNNFVRLSFWGNLKLKLHLAICSACKTYQQQSLTIDQFFKKHAESSLREEEIKENHPISSTGLKNQIINHLNNI
ncbi:MAG: hypothetical protein A3K10_05780 [Bacteroidetes bacterium RIFCSPLOWO2_12_FULL_31_6]|nr:MAG: hypothetical protein A3K10_05780 [Bacteroidetes bacterium RIFCSPLOWO2_12_FULL_31_6]